MKKKIILILLVLMCAVLLNGCKGDNTTTHIKGKIISIENYRYTKRIIIENDNQRFYIDGYFDEDDTSKDFILCVIGDNIECSVNNKHFVGENFKILN